MDRELAIKKLNSLKTNKINIHDLAKKYGITVSVNGRQNKGWAGLTIHAFLGDRGNLQKPDFEWGELKTFPLKYLKNGQLTTKESMQITMTNTEGVKKHDFKNSHVYDKLKKILLVSRIVGKNYMDPTYIYSVSVFDIETEFFSRLSSDYDEIKNFIIKNGYTKSKVGNLIQVRTKGAGKKIKKSIAFYARAKFMNKILKL